MIVLPIVATQVLVRSDALVTRCKDQAWSVPLTVPLQQSVPQRR
jgi:hypothetical protein